MQGGLHYILFSKLHINFPTTIISDPPQRDIWQKYTFQYFFTDSFLCSYSLILFQSWAVPSHHNVWNSISKTTYPWFPHLIAFTKSVKTVGERGRCPCLRLFMKCCQYWGSVFLWLWAVVKCCGNVKFNSHIWLTNISILFKCWNNKAVKLHNKTQLSTKRFYFDTVTSHGVWTIDSQHTERYK